MPHTLVTGANSFVAAHIIDHLISKGHTVTGSVRRKAAGEAVLALHPEWAGKLDFIEIENYSAPGVWDSYFKGTTVDYIMHVAAPMYADSGNTDYDRDWLKAGVEK
jgi:nucleoside-diphosphate-sugar epimerase